MFGNIVAIIIIVAFFAWIVFGPQLSDQLDKIDRKLWR